MINRLLVEKYQAVFYIVSISIGVLVGANFPEFSGSLELVLWPVLAFLLYVTFSQIPVAHIPSAIFDFKFITAALLGNFVFIPIFVALIIALLPNDPVLKLGVALVLLVPCTDWFITFTQLGKGDTKYAVALAPIILFAQFLLLPIYIYLMFGKTLTVDIAQSNLIEIFIWFIVIPLFAAYLTQKLADRNRFWKTSLNRMGWFPVPLLTLVVFIIFSSQFQTIAASKNIFDTLTIVFVLFLIVTVLFAKLLTSIFKLPVSQGRVLAFSFGTRNSFVVLPIVLALPIQYQTAIVVVAFQPLIELIGMLIYIKVIPNKIFKSSD
ncbi:arsenic resistance protein [Algoriphagus sp.]|uniref:arsenic resistance protein n=1 Tax=Algoriphagus sp. TaxID=1872435 RepID=UPI003919149E